MPPGTTLIAGDLRLDHQDARVFLNGRPLALGHKPFALLFALMQSPQKLLTKDELIDIVWEGRAVSDGVLTTAMRELRRSLDDDARHPKYIETVHGRGYRFLQMVQTEPPSLVGHTTTIPPAARSPRILKMFAVLIGAAIITASGFWVWTQFSSSDSTAPAHEQATDMATSVVILPFADLSPDNSNEWFASGLTQELITTLSRTSDLEVVSVDRDAVDVENVVNGAELARQLNLGAAVEGSVRRVDGRIRVNVQLSRAKDGVVVWSNAYDREDSEMIAIQENIAFELSNSLNTVTDPDQLRAMSSAGTKSVEAYQALLSGHYYLDQQYTTGEADYRRLAYEEYERARRIDPDFSEAHWLAARYWRERSTYIVPPGEASRYSISDISLWFDERITRAIETADHPIDRKKYLAARHLHQMEYATAIRLLGDYLEDRPNDTYAWVQLAEASTIRGDFELGQLAALRIAQLSEQQSIYRSRVIPIFLWARDIAGSVEQADRLLEMEPNNAFLQYHAHRTLLWAGEHDRARDLINAINGGALPAHNRSLSRIRQACADRDIESALAEYEELSNNRDASRASIWLAGQLVGDRAAADASLMDLDQTDRLHQLAAWLRYPHFDASAFPTLSQKLSMDRFKRPPPMLLPFRCDR